MQAGSQNAIGFIPVDVKDFPLPDMLDRPCLPAATTRETVGQTIVEQLLVNLSQLQESQSIVMA